MNSEIYAERTNDAMMIMLQISGPVLLAGVVVGVTIGLIQALTQIQDQTLPQAVKMLTIILMLVFLGPAFGQKIYEEAQQVLNEFPHVTR
jgi:type III secretion protein S